MQAKAFDPGDIHDPDSARSWAREHEIIQDQVIDELKSELLSQKQQISQIKAAQKDTDRSVLILKTRWSTVLAIIGITATVAQIWNIVN